MRPSRASLAGLLLAAAAALPGCAPAPEEPSGAPAAQETGAAAPTPTNRLGAVLADPGEGGFARAERVRAFEFPRDHGPHPDYRHEWWYFTGNLDAAGGERFGFELTIFRFALAPEPPAAAAAQATSAWRTRQIYMAHFAISDVAQRRFHFRERFARGALGLAGARAAPFRVWLEDWSVAAGERGWVLQAGTDEYALELVLQPLTAPVLNGDRGLSRKSAAPGAASYYYSIPRIEARGRLVRAGRAFEVSGLAWLDREWGSGALDPAQEGWDWFALQLDDGGTLMYYVLRRADGTRDPHSSGTWRAADGTVRALTSEEAQIEVLDRWESPRGGTYPARWRLRAPVLGLDVEVRPVLADQELDTSPRYWEGAVDVAGTRGEAAVRGRGYVELVGYAAGEGGLAPPGCRLKAVGCR